MSWQDLLSGQRRGPLAAMQRAALSGLTPIYRLAVAIRNRRFDRAQPNVDGGLITRAPIPVISIGNITTGGTGKTPHVIALARRLRELGCRVAVLSRGYGADPHSGGYNDEALEMEHRLPDVPQLQDRNRAALAQLAHEELGSQMALLDDGFQHRQLHRDLDIVLVDATLPWGWGRLLPRGLLREPPSSLARADCVILTRADQVSENRRQQLIDEIQRWTTAPLIQTRMKMQCAIPYQGTSVPLDSLRETPTLALCAIGNPENFFDQLTGSGINIVGRMTFPDHHRFTRQDLEQIGERAAAEGAQQLVCTHKDLVKLAVNRLGGIPLWAAQIEVEWLSGWPELDRRLESTVDQLPPEVE